MSSTANTAGHRARRIPPMDLQAEQAVIGAMLADPGAAGTVRGIVPPEACVDPVHVLIFQHLLHGPAPLETLAKQLAVVLEDVGGAAYLAQLRKPVEPDELERHARSVLDAWRRRTLLDVAITAGKLPSTLVGGVWDERPVLTTIQYVLRDVLAVATRLAVLERGVTPSGIGLAATVLASIEMDDLAGMHQRLAGEAHRDGDGERGDWHEARSAELGRLAGEAVR